MNITAIKMTGWSLFLGLCLLATTARAEEPVVRPSPDPETIKMLEERFRSMTATLNGMAMPPEMDKTLDLGSMPRMPTIKQLPADTPGMVPLNVNRVASRKGSANQ